MRKALILIIVLLTAFSIACNLSTFQTREPEPDAGVTYVPESEPINATEINPATDTPQPTIAVILPTKQPSATATAEPTLPAPEPTQESSTSEPASNCPAYGVEEFDQETTCWPATLSDMTSITTLTNSGQEFAGINNGTLEFKHVVADEIYLYAFNMQNEYDEVSIKTGFVKIDPSFNQNGATVACHVNESGWYEVRVESSGTFSVYHFDAAEKSKGKNPYVAITQGGVPGIQSAAGSENTILWTCREDSLSLAVNGKDVWTKEIAGMESGGGIGLGLVSFSGKFPLHIAYQSIEISEPR